MVFDVDASSPSMPRTVSESFSLDLDRSKSDVFTVVKRQLSHFQNSLDVHLDSFLDTVLSCFSMPARGDHRSALSSALPNCSIAVLSHFSMQHLFLSHYYLGHIGLQ